MTAQKPRPAAFVGEPKLLNEHLKKRRMELGLTQIGASRHFLVEEETYHNWENTNTLPQIRYYPSIISFLGYNPFFDNTSGLPLFSKLNLYRLQCGLSQANLGKLLKIDPKYISAWEKEEKIPSHGMKKKLEAWFASIS